MGKWESYSPMKTEDGESKYEFRKRWFASDKTSTERKAERATVRLAVEAARHKPCIDCGAELPPSCMDLDHTRGITLFQVTTFSAQSYSAEAILDELAKCDLRCPTCHRLRHYWLRTPDDPYFIDHPPYPSWHLPDNPYVTE